MKICISEKSVKDFNAYFRQRALTLQEQNNYKTLDELFRALYNDTMEMSGDPNSVTNHDVVVQHLAMAPMVGFDLFNDNNAEVMSRMSDVVQAMNDPKKLESLVKNIQEVVAQPIEIEDEISDKEPPANIPPQEVDYDSFNLKSAIHLGFNTMLSSETTGHEMVVDDKKITAHAVTRTVLNDVKNGSQNYRLVAMTFKNLQETQDTLKLDLSVASVPTKGQEKNSVVFLIADKDGNILQFTKDGRVTSDGVIPVYSAQSPTEIGEQHYDYFVRNKFDAGNNLHQRFAVLSKQLGKEVAAEDIKKTFTELKATFKKIREEGPMTFQIDPARSSYGYTEESKVNTPLTSIKNIGEFNITKVQTEDGAPYVITGHTLHEHKAVIIPNYIDTDSQVVDTLVKLLTTDNLEYNGLPVTPKILREILSNYTPVNANSKLQVTDNGSVKINNRVVPKGPKFEQTIRDFFTKFQVQEPVKGNPENRPVVKDLSQEGITSAMLYEDASGQLYKIYKPKFSYNKNTFEKVSVSGNQITTTLGNKSQHIIENSSTKTFVNNGTLQVYHPRLAFSETQAPMSDEDIADLFFKTDEQKKVNELVTKAQEQAALSWMESSPLLSDEVVPVKNALLKSEDRPEHRIAVAQWMGNAIVLYKGSDLTDVYHEAWHAFTQGILTPTERKQLYAEIRSTKGFKNKTDLQIEEYLAEKFREFAINNGEFKKEPTTLVGKLIRSVWNTLKSMFGKYSKSDLSNNSVVDEIVKEHFTNLYTHNIDVSKYNANNFQFKTLNKSLTLGSGKDLSKLNAQQTSLLLQSMDSLMTRYLDQHNTEKLSKGYQSLTDLVSAYKGVKNELAEKLKIETEALNAIEEEAGMNNETFNYHLANVEMLTTVLENYGNLDNMEENLFANTNPTNVIGFHLLNSGLHNYSTIKNVIESAEEDSDRILADGATSKSFERPGNDHSLFEMADEHIVYLLSSVTKYESKKITKEMALKKGRPEFANTYIQVPVQNDFGYSILEKPVVVMAKLGKLLNSTSGGDQMYKLMVEAAKEDRVIKEVLDKLGPYKSSSFTQQLLWSKFIQTFSKSNNRLQQFIIESRVDENTKELKLESKYGSVISGTKAVNRAWDASFPTSSSEYISTTPKGVVLDVQSVMNDLVVDKYNGKWGLKEDVSYGDFYRALGIDVTENKKIDQLLSENHDIFEAIATRLKNHIELNVFRDKNQETQINIGSLKQLFGSHSKVVNNEVVKQSGLNRYYNRLQKIEFDHSDKYNSFMAATADGSNKSELSLNNTASVMTNDINEIPEGMTIEEIISQKPHLKFLNPNNDPFMRANRYHKELFGKEGVKTKSRLTFENFSGSTLVQAEDDFMGLSNMDLDKDSKFMTDVYLSFLNKSEVLRMADKTTSMHMGIDKPQLFTPELVRNLSENDPTMVNALFDYLVAEIVRINTLKKIDTAFDQSYKKRGSEFFIFDDMLSDEVKNELYSITETDFDKVSEKIRSMKSEHKKSSMVQALVSEINDYFQKKTDVLISENASSLFITDSIRQSIEDSINQNLSESQKITVDDTLAREIMIGMFQRNKFLHNLDVTTFYLGDPALYNVEKEDFHKRNAGLISTGNVFRTDESFYEYINEKTDGKKKSRGWTNAVTRKDAYTDYDGTLATAVINDHEIKSIYLNEISQYIDDIGAYENMNEADGQGFISFDSYRILSIAEGIWTNEQEEQYNLIVNGSTVDQNGNVVPGSYDQTKYNTFFPSMKLQYFGPLMNDAPLRQQAFHKFNLIPLIPSMVKGKKLELLHKQMMEQGVDYLTFASGSKLSTVSNNETGSDSYYSEDRQLDGTMTFEKNIIHTKYLKNQLKIHNHFTGKVTLPTQMRKILVASIYNQDGVPRDWVGTKEKWDALSEEDKNSNSKMYSWKDKFIKALDDIVEFKKQELYNELGIKDPLSLLTDSSKLVNLIRREFRSKDYTESQIEFLFENNQLKNDLSTALTADQVEKLLLALVDKRITKLKINGEGLIQMASTMSESITESKTGNILEDGTNDLRTYYKKNGEIQGMQVKIALQGNFEKLLYMRYVSEETVNEDGSISKKYKSVSVFETIEQEDGTKVRQLDYDATLAEINKLLKNPDWVERNRDLITLSGPRIPSQDWNSLEFMEIAEFLPKNSGNVMVVPSEIVAKAGSDFDVDKLLTMFPNFDLYNGIPELIEYTDINTDQDAIRAEMKNISSQISERNDQISKLLESTTKNKQLIATNKQIYAINQEIFALRNKKDDLSKQRLSELESELSFERNIQSYILEQETSPDNPAPRNAELRASNKAVYQQVDSLRDQIEDLQYDYDNLKRKLNGASVKGLENNLLRVIVERMRMEEVYPDMVRPNSTAKTQPLAMELEEKVASFNKYKRVNGKSKIVKDKKVISKTMIFDPMYNINKQLENSVGKETLGIGAVGTSYFALFTSIGMYLNQTNGISRDTFEKALAKDPSKRTKDEQDAIDNFVDYTIKLPHNTRTETPKMILESGEVVYGDPQTVIDLSAVMNQSGESISDLLGQLINGWVDIAKDAWIFNIQGNKEVAPTLIFLLMAGVDLRKAVMLSSSRLVREYIQNKRTMASAFYGLQTLDKNDSKTHDLIQYYTDLDVLNVTLENLGKPQMSSLTQVYQENMYNTLDIDRVEELVLNPDSRTEADDQIEYDALINFIAYEQTAKQITELTTSTGFDTKTFSTLAEVRNSKSKFENLSTQPALPSDIVERIRKSAIGMFNTNDFQLNLWEQFFGLRTNSLISEKANDHYKGVLYQKGRTKADNEKDFAHEFISFLYQNESSRIENNTYKGIRLEPVSDVDFLYELKDGVLKYDEGSVIHMANEGDFGNTNSVLKYLVENAIMENTVDMSDPKVKDSISYKMALDAIELTEDNPEYNETLESLYRDAEAIIKTGNSVQLFKGSFSFANRLAKLKEKHPMLARQFYLVNDLTPDVVEGGRQNLYLLNLQEPGYKEVYEENLAILKDHYDPEIKEFFRMFDRYAVLQSGVKSFGKYVMTSIIDQNHIENVIRPVRNEIVSQFNKVRSNESESVPVLDTFTRLFYKIDSSGKPNAKAFKGFLIGKGRGTSYEQDNYFSKMIRKVDESPMTLQTLEDRNVSPLDIDIADNSTKAIVFTTKDSFTANYQKYSKINKYRGHLNGNYPSVLNDTYSSDDTVWIVGETVNELAYGNENNKSMYEGILFNQFKMEYVPVIQKALESGVTNFNVSGNTGIDILAKEYLQKNSGLIMHKIVTKNGTYYRFSNESEIIVDGLYSTLPTEIKMKEKTPLLSLNNVSVSLTMKVDGELKSYDNALQYFTRFKFEKANNNEKARITEELKKLKGQPTNEQFIQIINSIRVSASNNASYNEELEIRRMLWKISDKNLHFKNELYGTGKALLNFGNSQFERNFATAMMELRKHYRGPATKNTDSQEDPLAC